MMKKLILLSLLILFISCKKTEYAPEGPTDVRIKNQSDLTFTNVIISTSEYEEDKDTIPVIISSQISEYSRFRKAYPKAEISAKIDIDGALVTFSTGPVIYTYMQYLSTQRVTFEVYISNMTTHELKISNLIPEEELVLK